MEDGLQESLIDMAYNPFKGKSINELMELKNKIGTKKFSQIIKGSEKNINKDEYLMRKSASFKSSHDINENMYLKKTTDAPSEVRMCRNIKPIASLKKKSKNVVSSSSKDPRFNEGSGNLDIDKWRKNFSFLTEKRKEEKTVLLKAYKKCKNEKDKKELRKNIHRMKNQERDIDKREQIAALQREEKLKAIKSLQEGKKPYFSNIYQKKKKLDEQKNKNQTFVRKEKRLLAKERKRNLIDIPS